MKKPTTPFAIAVQEKVKINKAFLLSQGWELIEEKPLFDTFRYRNNEDIICSIGLYGGFSLIELDWCNKTPAREFTTINPNLTEADYYEIARMLNIKVGLHIQKK